MWFDLANGSGAIDIALTLITGPLDDRGMTEATIGDLFLDSEDALMAEHFGFEGLLRQQLPTELVFPITVRLTWGAGQACRDLFDTEPGRPTAYPQVAILADEMNLSGRGSNEAGAVWIESVSDAEQLMRLYADFITKTAEDHDMRS